MTAGKGSRLALGALLVGLLASGHAAFAQDRPQSGEGYEVSLFGTARAVLGAPLRVSGIAYSVRGLARLEPLPGARVVLRLTRAVGTPDEGVRRETVVESRALAAAEGRFSLSVDVPLAQLDAPQLEVLVGHEGRPGRVFTFEVTQAPAFSVTLLTDRQRYEPGETVHVWARVGGTLGDAPRGDLPTRLTVRAADGRQLAEAEVRTSAAGVVTLDVPLDRATPESLYVVRCDVLAPGGGVAERGFTVARRTTERLQATAALDQRLVAPGGTVTGVLTVRSPSGAPVRNAHVRLFVTGDEDGRDAGTTDARGELRFTFAASAYLSGDVASGEVVLTARHPARGSVRTRAAYVVARTQWSVELSPAAGGLVPETETDLYVAVTSPLGEPAPAGTPVLVSGAAREAVTLQTDASGLARLSVRTPRSAITSTSEGDAVTFLDVAVGSPVQSQARLSVPVAREARVWPRVVAPVVLAGDAVQVELRRAPGVRDVLVEVLRADDDPLAVVWARPGEARVSIPLPASDTGVLHVRARPLDAAGPHPLDARGGRTLGTGAYDAFLVRPADAFRLEVRADASLHGVRETARVALGAGGAPVQGFAAVLVRDLAQHGGELPFEVAWRGDALDRALLDPSSEPSDVLLRAALVAPLAPDEVGVGAAPIVIAPWSEESEDGTYDPPGTLRDAHLARDVLLRATAGEWMTALEEQVASLAPGSPEAAGLLVQRGLRVDFDPQIFAHLVEQGSLEDASLRTLGDAPLTLAELREADPSFTFDNVARRIARVRLVTLLSALVAFGDPDDENAARLATSEPPERWLGALLRAGLVEPEGLLDPWGRGFAIRPARGGAPAVVFAERAAGLELVSAGPDGVFGSGDDVRDPFARVLPRGSVYAVASGEDSLMAQLAGASASATTLEQMRAAFTSMGLGAAEEQRGDIAQASASEEATGALMGDQIGEAFGFGGLGVEGTGMGGGGTGEGTIGLGNIGTIGHGAGNRRTSGGEDRDADGIVDEQDVAPEEPETYNGFDDEDGAPDRGRVVISLDEITILGREDAPEEEVPESTLATLAERIRERFPATLHFVAELPLSGPETLADVPLADALTTYRIEVIAWTASGWTTTGSTEVRVDQRATVDAPVPAYATVGDAIELPVRVSNRGREVLAARIEVEAEGLQLEAAAGASVEVPAQDAAVARVTLRLGAAGSGALVVRVRDAEGHVLDAVRRPLVVQPDSRLVEVRDEQLVIGARTLTLEVPAHAVARGPGSLHVALTQGLFGDPRESAEPWAAWALALTGTALPETLLGLPRAQVVQAAAQPGSYDAVTLAQALSAVWRDAAIDDALVRDALPSLAQVASMDAPAARDAWGPGMRAAVLMALAPALRAARDGARPVVAVDLLRMGDQLSEAVAADGALLGDTPSIQAELACALALGGSELYRARAAELLRRAERGVLRAGDVEWLDAPSAQPWDRVIPTASLALARVALGAREAALPPLRSLIALRRSLARWTPLARARASAAAALFTGVDALDGDVTVTLDGRAIEAHLASGVLTAELDGLGAPGAHRVAITLPSGALALATVETRYGLPWSDPPAQALAAELTVEQDAETATADARPTLHLTVRNRGARVLLRPVLRVELPAGSELDEPAREALALLLRQPPTVERSVLRLALAPLAPGAKFELDVPLRATLAGTLRGHGVVLVDEATPPGPTGRPVAFVASRAVTIAP